MLDAASYTPRLKAHYNDTVRAALKEEFSYKNEMMTPKLDNIGKVDRQPQAVPVDLSNLAYLDAKGKATRIGFKMDGDKKVRFAKSTGDVIDA